MLKKYNSFLKENTDENIPLYMRDELDYTQSDDYEEDEETDEESENLLYWIRTFFTNSNIDAEVELDKLDVFVYCYLNKKSSLKEIVNILDVAKKLSKDILPQYKSRLSMYETKQNESILELSFFYYEDEELPFDL